MQESKKMKNIDKLQAIEIAEKYLQVLNSERGEVDKVFLLLEEIIEKDYGWIFPYAGKKYVETKDPLYMSFDDYPFLVEKEGGTVVDLDAPFALGDPIEFYEQTGEGRRTKIV
jgi:hypothetical protein